MLTPRQTQVLHALAEGLDNAAIGAKLGISRYTVGDHIAAACHRAGIESLCRVKLIVWAFRKGLIS